MTIFKGLLRIIKRLVEAITATDIVTTTRPKIKIKLHPNAVSDGRAMAIYVDLVDRFCNFKPKNVFEIGANYAQDAEYLRQRFGLAQSNIFVFEPHSTIIKSINELYGFNNYDMAVSNFDGTAMFNAIDVENNEYKNSGISSLKQGLTTNKENFNVNEVVVTRMDTFIKKNGIDAIDFLKIDVEGATYEVLEGFGDELLKVKAVQLEGEYRQYWEGQRLYWDIEDILKKSGFDLVYFMLSADGIQSDSFWVQRRYLVKV